MSCPGETITAAMGGRWKVLVIQHLLDAKQPFGELIGLLGGVSARVPGRELESVLYVMHPWGERLEKHDRKSDPEDEERMPPAHSYSSEGIHSFLAADVRSSRFQTEVRRPRRR